MVDPPFTPRRSPADPTQFRILCPSMKTGAIIGKGGSTVRHIQSLTGAKIRLLDDPHHPPCEERVILITNPNPQNPKSDDTGVGSNGGADGCGEDDGLGTVQKALVRVFEKVVKGDSEEELGEGFVVGIRILVAGNQMGTLFGRGGHVVEKIRVDTGAQIRVLNREQIPLCALPGDEMIVVSGNFCAVKKSLLAISSCLQDCPRAEAGNSSMAKPPGLGYQGGSLPGQVDLPQRGYASGHSADYHSRGYPPNMGPENIGPRGRMNFEEEVVFKLLCQQEKVGSLIGKGGCVIRAIENETGAFIKIADPVPDSDERVVDIFPLFLDDSSI